MKLRESSGEGSVAAMISEIEERGDPYDEDMLLLFKKLSAYLSVEAIRFLFWILEFYGSKRPSASAVLQCSFLSCV